MSGAARRPRGRPRDRGIDRRVLEATLGVVAERGVGGAAMDEIAQRSGVSKATIYGRWPSKDALCLDAVRFYEPQLPIFASADARTDCIGVLSHLLGLRDPAQPAGVLPRLLAEVAQNIELARIFHEHLVAPPRAACAAIVRRAIDDHQLKSSTDVSLAVDLLIGPVFYRRLIGGAAPAQPSLPTSIVDAVWSAFRAW